MGKYRDENTRDELKRIDKEKAVEFLLVHAFLNEELLEKYEDKLIYKYDLKAFRDGGWSKELDILRSNLSQEDRVLQALIVSQYRLKIAEKYHIRCKPVILFKAQKKI